MVPQTRTPVQTHLQHQLEVLLLVQVQVWQVHVAMPLPLSLKNKRCNHLLTLGTVR